MKQTVTKLIMLLAAFTAAGCTSMQELQANDRPLEEVLRQGDHIVVYENSGRIVDMRYVRMDGRLLLGSLYANGLSTVEVDVDDIERIEIERISAGRTTLAVMGGIALAPIAALGMGAELANQ